MTDKLASETITRVPVAAAAIIPISLFPKATNTKKGLYYAIK